MIRYKLDNKGQMAVYEAIIIMVLIIALGLCLWVILAKKTESNVYQSGSKPVNYDIKPGFGGCASTKVMEYLNEKPKK